jgi:hypothetical protein
MPDTPKSPDDQINPLLEEMQKKNTQAATQRGFRATPGQLERAAVAAALVAELARLTLALDLHGWDDQAQALERVLAEVAANAEVALDGKLWSEAAMAPKREGASELIALTQDSVRRAAALLGRDPEAATADWGVPLRGVGAPEPALAELLDRVTPENTHAEVPASPAGPKRTLNLNDLLAYAAFVLDSVEAAKEWFSEPHQLLGDRTPAEVAQTPDGAQRVRRLLDGLEWSLPL